MIMPQTFNYKIATKSEASEFQKKGLDKIADVAALEQSEETKTTVKQTKFAFKLSDATLENTFNNSSDQFTLVEFSTEQSNFQAEKALLQVYHDQQPRVCFLLDLDAHTSRVLSFDESVADARLQVLERMLLIVKASFAEPRMGSVVKDSFADSMTQKVIKCGDQSKINEFAKELINSMFEWPFEESVSADNLELFLVFLEKGTSLLAKHLSESPHFKANFGHFRRRIKLLTIDGNTKAFERFSRVEHQLTEEGVNLKRLTDRVRRMSILAQGEDRARLAQSMGTKSLETCQIDSEDIPEIMHFYQVLREHINQNHDNEHELGLLIQLTGRLNEFRGESGN